MNLKTQQSIPPGALPAPSTKPTTWPAALFWAVVLWVGLSLPAHGQAVNITNGLVLWLPFTNTSGLTVTDESLSANGTNADGNDAALGNFPATGNGQWLPGIDGNSLNFNALTNAPAYSNEFVYVQDAPDLNFTNSDQLQFTLALWFNCNSGAAGTANTEPSGACLIDKGVRQGALGGQQYTIDFNGSYIRYYCLNAAGTAYPAASGGSTNNPGAQVGVPTPFKPVNGTWYHLTATYSGQSTNLQMSLYIDGIPTNAGVSSKILQALNWSTNGVNIGNRNNTAGNTNFNAVFKGAIADLRIYNRVLSAQEVTNIVGLAYEPPTIAASPQSLFRYTNDPVSFSVSANSSALPTFQWTLNGVPLTNGGNITGATTQTLLLNNLQLSQAGNYTVIVSNAYGMATSAPALLTISNLPPADTNTDLIAYWNLNEGSGGVANDSSPNDPGNLNTAMIYGATWDTGILGDSLLFGLNTVAASPDIDTSDNGVYDFSTNLSFTLACWVNGATTQASGSCIIAKGFGGGGEQYTMDTSGNVYRFYVRDAFGNVTQTGITNSPNAHWQHLACVFDATNSIMYYYINGQLVGSAIPPTSLLSNTHELSFGCRQSSTGAYNDYWTGDIDEVHIYSRALNSGDVEALYAAAGAPPVIQTSPASLARFVNDPAFFAVTTTPLTLGPLTYQWALNGASLAGATNSSLALTNLQTANAGDYTVAITSPFGSTTSAPPAILTVNALPAPDTNANLVAWWKFDETNGYTAADSSGNGNTAQLSGFASDPAEWVSGILGGALQFNADASGADVAAVPNVGQSDNGTFDFSSRPAFTLACWVKGSPIQTNGSGIVAKGYGGGGEQYTVDTFGNVFRFYVRDQTTNSYGIQTTVHPDNLWQHLAAVYDATNGILWFYINGQVVNSAVNVVNGLATSPLPAPVSLLSNQHELSAGNRESSSVSTYNLPWTGAIDDLRIYNRALNSGDIQALVANSNSVLAAGTISFSLAGSTALTNGSFQFSGSASGGGAVANVAYRVWAASDLTLPLSQWTPVATNTFGANGQFSFVVANSGGDDDFFKITVP